MLVEQGDTQSGVTNDNSCGGIQVSNEQTENGGLAHTITSDDSPTLAFAKGE
jgi:hypothetical protein